MSVSIKYKGSEIAALTATGTKTLKTAGKYCEGDITVQNTEGGEALGDPTTLTVTLPDDVYDAVIIAQQSRNIYKVTLGATSETFIDTVVGGMVSIFSPTTPLAIANGDGVFVDYTINQGDILHLFSDPTTWKAVKVTAENARVDFSVG